MTPADSSLVFIACLVLGAVAGMIMHRADFCLAAAFRDLFLFRSAFMLRQVFLAVVTSLILFDLLERFGLLAELPFPLMGGGSWTHLVGGVVFGCGMVLAGGCVVGSLYRAGAGNGASLLALFGLLAGSLLYAEIHPAWKVLHQRLQLPIPWELPTALGWPVPAIKGGVAVAGAAALAWWFKKGVMHRTAFAQGYLQPWRAALGLAWLGALSALLVGMPLGITTAYVKAAGWTASVLAPGHIADMPYFAEMPLDYRHPLIDGMVLRGGAGPAWDGIALVQFPVVIGIFAGAAASALLLKEWRLHWQIPARQAVSALTGGVLMGLASRLAPGCNVWHLLGGLPILAIGSILFVFGLFPGAWLGTRIFQRWVI